jgi:hypothetical protein
VRPLRKFALSLGGRDTTHGSEEKPDEQKDDRRYEFVSGSVLQVAQLDHSLSVPRPKGSGLVTKEILRPLRASRLRKNAIELEARLGPDEVDRREQAQQRVKGSECQ